MVLIPPSSEVPPRDDVIYCGIDVGKHYHYLVALDASGKKVISKKCDQDERSIRQALEEARCLGIPIVVVDQPRSIGAFLVTVWKEMRIDIYYLSSLAMRRFADLHPGNAKTDTRDAWMIAKAAFSMPDLLRIVSLSDNALAHIRILAGFDDDLAKENTMLVNRLRALLSEIHPGLERALSPHFDQKIGIALLRKYGGPTQLKAMDKQALEAFIKQYSPRSYRKILEKITEALTAQTVVVPGTIAAEKSLQFTAMQLHQLREQRDEIEKEFEDFLGDNPFGDVILSMSGIGMKLGVKILMEIGDITRFKNQRHLATYAGLAPRTHRSGTSIKGEYAQHAGNKRLKNYLFRAAFASLSDPRSRTYYDRKRSEGKTHNAAIICLARQRCTTLHKMLTTNTFYQYEYPQPALDA